MGAVGFWQSSGLYRKWWNIAAARARRQPACSQSRTVYGETVIALERPGEILVHRLEGGKVTKPDRNNLPFCHVALMKHKCRVA